MDSNPTPRMHQLNASRLFSMLTQQQASSEQMRTWMDASPNPVEPRKLRSTTLYCRQAEGIGSEQIDVPIVLSSTTLTVGQTRGGRNN